MDAPSLPPLFHWGYYLSVSGGENEILFIKPYVRSLVRPLLAATFLDVANDSLDAVAVDQGRR